MSSACVCHTDEWCFYCEMFLPLERKYNAQTTAIEQLIKIMEEKLQHLHPHASQHIKIQDAYYDMGAYDYLSASIDKLKGVIAAHDHPSNGQTSPSSTHDTAEQV